MTETITEFGPRRTVLILAIVAGCFAMLWPKILYPMLKASVAPAHSTTYSPGCCDVIFEDDVSAADIMQELCFNIVKHQHVEPRLRDALRPNKFEKLTPSNARLCKEEVLSRCGIDLSSFLAEKDQLKKTYKQVLEDIRGSNRSLCLKTEFGVPLSRLVTRHLNRYRNLMPRKSIKQERQTPPHAGSYHPALRERGRAIPSSHIVPKIQDRADHLAPMKMRPPLGGAGHVVAAPKGNGSLGLLMPLYTIGIVIFFLYTISKVLMGFAVPLYTIGNALSLLYKVFQVLRKSTDSEITRSEYSSSGDAEREYQKLVFNPEVFAAAITAVNGAPLEQEETYASSSADPCPLIDDLEEQEVAGDIEIDQLRRRLVETEAAMERIVVQISNLSRSVMHCSSPPSETKESNILQKTCGQDEQDPEDCHEILPTVKVLNMETTASCEGGVKCSRPSTPIPTPHGNAEEKEKTPPISIYLEGALPPQCELLVTDSKTQEIQEQDNVEVPIVLSGKMTLSLISLDQESLDSNLLEPTIGGEIATNSPKKFSSEYNESEIEINNENSIDERVEEGEEGEEVEEIYDTSSEEDDVESDKSLDDRVNNLNIIAHDRSLSRNPNNQESLEQKHNEKFDESITHGDDFNVNDNSDADDGSEVDDNSDNNQISRNIDEMIEDVEEDESEYELEYENQEEDQEDRESEQEYKEESEKGPEEYEKEIEGEEVEIEDAYVNEIEEYEGEIEDKYEGEIEEYEEDEEYDEEEDEEYDEEEDEDEEANEERVGEIKNNEIQMKKKE